MVYSFKSLKNNK